MPGGAADACRRGRSHTACGASRRPWQAGRVPRRPVLGAQPACLLADARPGSARAAAPPLHSPTHFAGARRCAPGRADAARRCGQASGGAEEHAALVAEAEAARADGGALDAVCARLRALVAAARPTADVLRAAGARPRPGPPSKRRGRLLTCLLVRWHRPLWQAAVVPSLR